MSKLIDSVVQHFSNLGVREIEVPEWEATLYVKNLTIEDKAKLNSHSQDDIHDYMVYAIIFGVVDSEGNPVFDIGDKVKLRRHASSAVVERVANEVLAFQTQSEEDREKNERTTKGTRLSFTGSSS